MLLDLKKLKLRSVNEKLQNIDRKKNKETLLFQIQRVIMLFAQV